jgi:hypothetical protein
VAQPPSTPVPLTAVYDTATLTLTVTFDQALVAKTLGGGGPWTIIAAGFGRSVLSKTMAGTTATIVTDAGTPAIDPDNVIYTPPPNNIQSLATGANAAPFSIVPTIV